MSNSKSLRRLNTADAGEIACLHLKAFENFFLSSLGTRFLNVFYKSVLENSESVGYGLYKDGTMIGFIVGTKKAKGFYMQVLKARFVPLFCSAIFQLVKRPKIIAKLLRSLIMGGVSGDNSALILSICVAPAHEGSGFGTELLRAIESFFLKCGMKEVVLTTDADDNTGANKFYMKNGYIIKGKIIQSQNRHMNIYVKSVI